MVEGGVIAVVIMTVLHVSCCCCCSVIPLDARLLTSLVRRGHIVSDAMEPSGASVSLTCSLVEA